ncbi:hypothetical protein Landi51_08791 [Colletotrichum acutatum]
MRPPRIQYFLEPVRKRPSHLDALGARNRFVGLNFDLILLRRSKRNNSSAPTWSSGWVQGLQRATDGREALRMPSPDPSPFDTQGPARIPATQVWVKIQTAASQLAHAALPQQRSICKTRAGKSQFSDDAGGNAARFNTSYRSTRKQRRSYTFSYTDAETATLDGKDQYEISMPSSALRQLTDTLKGWVPGRDFRRQH